MLNLPLKQAEMAFAKGQLDEAFSLVRHKSARSTRQAQEFVARLVPAIVARGRDHLSEGRLTAAASDAAKAVELGGGQADVIELFEAVQQKKSSLDRRQRHQQGLLREARRQIDCGDGSAGKLILDRADADQTAVKHLAEQLDVQTELSEAALIRAREAIDAGQPDQALEILIPLWQRQPHHRQAVTEICRAAEKIVGPLWEHLHSGRLDRLWLCKDRLEAIAEVSTIAGECVDIMHRCRRIRTSIDRMDYETALQELGLLQQLVPQADWIAPQRDLVQNIHTQRSQLQSGPLGLVPPASDSLPVRPARVMPTTLFRPADLDPPPLAASPSPTAPTLPARLLLQIDGIGSILLLRSELVRIGSASRSQSLELPLVTDGIETPIQIRRQGEDYLLTSDQPVKVNERAFTSRLLADGDIIRVGRRGRLRFGKPIAASATAMLELTGAPLIRNDVRRVVLFADSLILGPESSSQLALRGVQGRYALLAGGDTPSLRPLGSGGRVVNLPIELGRSIVVDDIRMRITDFDAAQTPGKLLADRSRNSS
ncbi:MAG: hypothetical protein MI861_23490 [Pirellulales bacterium]|nr:hypothetical protein [Pirellulales bacterium]